MDTNKVLLVLCISFGLIVLLNGALVLSYRRNRTSHPFQGVLTVFKAARNPWREEERNLEELRNRVADLNKEAEEDQKSE